MGASEHSYARADGVLTVLLGTHGTRIDVHVRVDLDGGDLKASSLEEQARRGG